MTGLRAVLAEVTARLDAAGVENPRVDAEFLAAHVLGVPRSRLLLVADPDPDALARLEAQAARRADREPLQHVLGTAVLGPVEVAVGPGVFVPRPETELLFAWGVARLRDVDRPTVVELCAGSAALALAVAAERPDALVHAVEREPAALEWARRNVARAGSSVVVHDGDVTAPDVLADLDGTVDLVLCNPPYVPAGTPVPPEVHHDPAVAVFAGADGLDVIRPVVGTARRLLRAGGAVGLEHDQSHAAEVRALLADAGFADVETLPDLAGRPRFGVGTR